MLLHPLALQAHLNDLGQAERLLLDALREGSRQSSDWPQRSSLEEARDYARRQHWADRIERFLRCFCGTLVELRRAAKAATDPAESKALRSLLREVDALLRHPLDAHGATLSGLLLMREPNGAWGADTLNLEFCVRRRPAALLLMLEAFATEQLGLLLLLLRHFELASVTAIIQAAESSALASTA